MKRSVSLVVVMLLCVLSLFGCQQQEKEQVVIFTWSDYFPQETLDAFTEATGIEVVYTYFESNEEMLTKLQENNGGGYDVVLASDYIIDIARQEGLLMELDKSQIPNFANIDPIMQGQFYDPEDKYAVPFAAGTPLIVYDPAKVDFEITGLADLWDPSLEDSIVVMDDARVFVGMTLKSMGYSLNETDPALIEAAGEKLAELKPNIRALDYNTPYQLMISGETSVGFMFTPQVIWAMNERPDLKLVYPKEGVGYGIDCCFVPSDAPNAENAHAFLNYILDGKVSAELSEFTQYINCVTTAKEYLSEEFLNNPALNIPRELADASEFVENIGTEAQDKYIEVWTRFKQG